MIYQFLTDEDIIQQIKQDLLENIIANETERQTKIRKAEASVLKQIRSKAGKWYDLDTVLISIKQWNTITNYLVGQYVYDEGVIYYALQDNTDLKPSANSLFWKSNDPRHELLVMYAVDMVLYHLHSLVNPRKIPDLRKERYNEAKSWLEQIADRNENADFPTNELDEELIIWGSNPKIQNYF